jgi:hypothetical protein
MTIPGRIYEIKDIKFYLNRFFFGVSKFVGNIVEINFPLHQHRISIPNFWPFSKASVDPIAIASLSSLF